MNWAPVLVTFLACITLLAVMLIGARMFGAYLDRKHPAVTVDVLALKTAVEKVVEISNGNQVRFSDINDRIGRLEMASGMHLVKPAVGE